MFFPPRAWVIGKQSSEHWRTLFQRKKKFNWSPDKWPTHVESNKFCLTYSSENKAKSSSLNLLGWSWKWWWKAEKKTLFGVRCKADFEIEKNNSFVPKIAGRKPLFPQRRLTPLRAKIQPERKPDHRLQTLPAKLVDIGDWSRLIKTACRETNIVIDLDPEERQQVKNHECGKEIMG